MKSGFYGHDFSFWFSVRFHAGESGVCIWFGFWSPASDTVGSKDTRKLWHETRHSCVTPRGSCPALFTPRFQNHAAIDQGCCWAPPYNIPRSCGRIAPQSWWLSGRSSHFIALCWGGGGRLIIVHCWRKSPRITRTSCPLDEALLTFWPKRFEAKLFLEVRILPGPLCFA